MHFKVRIVKARMRWAGYIACMGKERNAYRILVGNPKGRRPLEKPVYKWDDNIKMDVKQIGWVGLNWILRVLSSGTKRHVVC
jgi:hypothetical protein